MLVQVAMLNASTVYSTEHTIEQEYLNLLSLYRMNSFNMSIYNEDHLILPLREI